MPVYPTNGGSAAPVPSYLCTEQAVRDDCTFITITAWDRTWSGPRGMGEKPTGWKEAEHRLLVRKSLANEIIRIFTHIHNVPEAQRVPIRRDKDSDGVPFGIQGFNFRCSRPCAGGYGGQSKCLQAIARDQAACRRCLSTHAQAMAFDINVPSNPYYRKRRDGTLPPNPYWNRERHPKLHHYAIRRSDAIWQAFNAYGWVWGGEWTKSKDYMHFSKNGE